MWKSFHPENYIHIFHLNIKLYVECEWILNQTAWLTHDIKWLNRTIGWLCSCLSVCPNSGPKRRWRIVRSPTNSATSSPMLKTPRQVGKLCVATMTNTRLDSITISICDFWTPLIVWLSLAKLSACSRFDECCYNDKNLISPGFLIYRWRIKQRRRFPIIQRRHATEKSRKMPSG